MEPPVFSAGGSAPAWAIVAPRLLRPTQRQLMGVLEGARRLGPLALVGQRGIDAALDYTRRERLEQKF